MNPKRIFNGAIVSCALLAATNISAQPLSLEINQNWHFKQARLSNWHPAKVPGVIQTDLMANDLLSDPFYRLNEKEVQWVDKEDWEYKTTFRLTPQMLNQQHILMNFEGLDTYADVYLNDSLILKANNMFRSWEIPITELVEKGKNTLRVFFHSPLKHDLAKFDALNFQYFANNDQSQNGGMFNKKLSIFARKAGFHYGWDWGPRLVTMGIWKPITVVAWSDARIDDVYMEQTEVTKSKANLETQVSLSVDHPITNASIRVIDQESKKVIAERIIDLQKGEQTIHCPFTILNPKLWWTNGLGDAYRYQFKTEVIVDSKVIDFKEQKIGVRSLKIIQKKDQYGSGFYFELNGEPVFAKGANYIPQDNFLTRVTDADYTKTVMSAVESNMNMLRVWGGGLYEKEIFYDLCDEHGILVWQDFMFACSMYPAEGELLENIRQEAIDNVIRLRNHASIALWCGNNECQDAWYDWEWNKKYEAISPAIAAKVWKQFSDLYYVTLPEVVAKYAPQTYYHPSSPFSGKGQSSNDHSGDRHYWGIWHGKAPISNYNIERSRFFSEYGFQSFPEYISVIQYAPKEKDWDIYSDVMMSHQRGGKHANSLIESYMVNEYYRPKEFKKFLYVNQVLQGDAIRTAMEAHRRDMPYCMGTLYWQINDCWPVASWSSRDYYGRWKAQHYFTKKAYDDVLVSPYAKDNKLNIYVVSDRLENFTGQLEVQVMTFDGKIVFADKKRVHIKANGSHILADYDTDAILNQDKKQNSKKDVFIVAKLIDNKKKVYENTYELLKQKEMNYPKVDFEYTIKRVHLTQPITESMDQTAYTYEMTITAPLFARAVHLMVNDIKSFFSDNYFDLLPGESKIIYLSTNLDENEIKESLIVESL